MSVFLHEAQECLLDRGEYFAGIPSKLGTEVLGSVERTSRPNKIDTRVDLRHVLRVWTEWVVGELRCDLIIRHVCRMRGDSVYDPYIPLDQSLWPG